MSTQSTKEFIKKMSEDEAFRTKILNVKDLNERIKLINTEGFDCTTADIEALLNELNDKELEGVAGGVDIKKSWYWFRCNWCDCG